MGKAESLNELKTHLLNVPKFISINEEQYLNNRASIYRFITQFQENTTFAIRSSANIEDGEFKSFAGIFNSYLNIHRNDVVNYIQLCINDKNLERVKEYCSTFNIKKAISMNVIIQEMINSDISGVCFSMDPVSKKDNYIIECAYGIGEGVVSGLIDPDQIIYDPKNDFIISYKVKCEKSKLKFDRQKSGLENVPVEYLDQCRRKISIKQLNVLISAVKKIKNIFNNKDVDVEWAYKDNVLYILQARLITTI